MLALRLSNITDCRGGIEGGIPSKSEDYPCGSCHPDPLASSRCGMCPIPYPYLGVNPDVNMVGDHSIIGIIVGIVGVGEDCAGVSFCLVLL